MKTDLICRMTDICLFPESCSWNFSIYIILDIIINSVICHRSFHNVVSMWFSTSAMHDKIKPLLCHFVKNQILQLIIRCIFLAIQYSWWSITCCPPYCLFRKFCTIKAKIKIFMIQCFFDFRKFYNVLASMI